MPLKIMNAVKLYEHYDPNEIYAAHRVYCTCDISDVSALKMP